MQETERTHRGSWRCARRGALDSQAVPTLNAPNNCDSRDLAL